MPDADPASGIARFWRMGGVDNQADHNRSASAGRGSAIHPHYCAVYVSQAPLCVMIRDSIRQIVVPWGGPPMRGGLRPLFRAGSTQIGTKTTSHATKKRLPF